MNPIALNTERRARLGGEGRFHERNRDFHAALQIADARVQRPRVLRETPIFQGIPVAARRAHAWVPDVFVTQHLDR
jgi:hypothetical protein